MQRLAASLVCAALASGQSLWDDCSPGLDGHVTGLKPGRFGPASQLNATWKSKPLVVLLPRNTPSPAPLVVFMHGSTGQIEMYQPILEAIVSHGFVVAFPYVKGPEEDKSPLTTNTDGTYILNGIDFARHASVDPSSALHNKVDLQRIIVAGHSMGATCSIMAGSRLAPEDGVRLVITQHPGICGPFGPPPWPYTWLESDLANVVAKFPVLFTTASNDGAFWPAPYTAEHEMGCFNGTMKEDSAASSREPTLFVEFSKQACAEDKARQPFTDEGHNCPFKVDVEAPWVLTAMKLFGQQDGKSESTCAAMLYGRQQGSLSEDAKVAKLVLHRGSFAGRATEVLV